MDVIIYLLGDATLSLLIVTLLSLIGVAIAHALRQKFQQRTDGTNECTNSREYHKYPVNPVQYIHYLYHRICIFFRKYIYLKNDGNNKNCQRTQKNTIDMLNNKFKNLSHSESTIPQDKIGINQKQGGPSCRFFLPRIVKIKIRYFTLPLAKGRYRGI